METENSRAVLDPGIDIFQVLKNDHKTVRKLMDELLEASVDEKEGVLSQLDTALLQHADLEERFFYPRLEDYAELRPLIQQALNDHREIRDLLQRMESEEVLSVAWNMDCDALEAAVDNHVEREELQIMVQAKGVVPPDDLRRMKEQVLEAQSKIPQPPRHRDSGPPPFRL